MGTQPEVLGIGQCVVDLRIKLPAEDFSDFKLPGGEFALVTPAEQDAVLAQLIARGVAPTEAAAGSVVNSMFTTAALNGRAELVARLGSDDRGRRFLGEVRDAQITFDPLTIEGATAASLIVVGPEGQRIMRTTLGIAETVDPSDIAPDRVQGAAWVLLEGYMLNCAGGLAAFHHALETAHQRRGTAVALSLSDPSVVRRHFDTLREMLPQCDLIFANAEEALAMTGTRDIAEALRVLGQMTKTVIVTAGPNGAYLVHAQRVDHLPAHRCAVVDTTGAGDSFAGALLTALVRDIELHRAIDGAQFIASKIVERADVRVPGPAVAAWAERLNIII